MNEELMNVLAENDDVDNINIDVSEMDIEDVEQDLALEDIVEVVEVEPSEEVEIDIDESMGWVGGDSTRHYSLVGRDENDQHPITAITGLRQELDDIEALKTVQSDKIGIANYYEWYNGVSYDEFGYFVSLAPHTSSIQICDGADIFGVTVENAGFVGGQNAYAPRNNTYALVVTSGVVDVRCESDVAEGDYVISNSSGVAEKTTSNCGYKVVATETKHGIKYAVISLGVQACTTDLIGKDVHRLGERMDDAEINIAATAKLANDAYNKSIETTEVSEEAIRNALEALKKADDAIDMGNSTNETLESVSQIVAQSQAIANGAVSSAEAIRKEAVEVANSSWVKSLEVQDEMSEFAAEMDPLASWQSEDGTKKGVAGFIARADADSATLATLAEWKEDGGDNQSLAGTIAKVNDHEAILNHLTSHQGTNSSTIAQVEQKADDADASITHLVAGIDKYSVGEYSQAYGLTLEQARKILKIGTIYIPTQHGDTDTHREEYNIEEDDFWTSDFTYGYYYEWKEIAENTVAWSESIGEVYFGPNQPSGDRYTYWYDDINLYLLKDGEWIKIATLAGNPNNRATSMIRQDLNSISAEVVNARGSAATLTARLEDTESKLTTTTQWAKGEDQHGNKMYNMAVIDQSANQDGSSLALTVADVNGNKTIKGASIVLNQSSGDSVITLDADKIVTNGQAFFTTSNGQTLIDGSKIITKTLKASDLIADTLQSNKYEPSSSGSVYSDGGTLYDLANGSISSKYFAVSSSGQVWAKGGNIANFTIHQNRLFVPYKSGKWGVGISSSSAEYLPAFYAGFKGNSDSEETPYVSTTWSSDTKFYVTNAGYLKATDAYIEGEIHAASGSFTGEIHAEKGLIGDALIEEGHLILPSSDNCNLILNGHRSFSCVEGGSPLFSSYEVANLEYFTPGTYTLTVRGKVVSTATQARQMGAYVVFMKKDANGVEQWWTSRGIFFSNTELKTKSHTFTISSDILSQCSSIYFQCHYVDVNGTCYDGEGAGSAVQWAVLTKGYRKATCCLPSVYYNTHVNKNLLSPVSFSHYTGCGTPVTNNKYSIAQYALNDEGQALEEGTTCTIQMKAKLGKSKSYITIGNSGGMCGLTGLRWENHFDNDEGVYVGTFKWHKTYTSNGVEFSAANTSIYVYIPPNEEATGGPDSTIEWVKLEKGSIATAYSSADDAIMDWTAPTTSETTITGGKVTTGLINAEKLKVDYIKSGNCTATTLPTTYTSAGTFIDLKQGGIYSKNFYIDSSGNAKFKGEIEATGGNIGGFILSKWYDSGTQTGYALRTSEELGTSNSIFLCNLFPTTTAIAGETKNDWRLGIGSNFGVDRYGDLYARNIKSSGIREGVKCSFSVGSGEIRQIGVTTDLFISGAEYIATGTDYLFEEERGIGKYEMRTYPWKIQFSYTDIKTNVTSPMADMSADGDGNPVDREYFRVNMGGAWHVSGGMSSASPIRVTSDANMKNSINYIDEQNQYEVFFDNCISRTFKYNDGTSDRTHTGFVAQEVKAAADMAGIDLKNLAAVCIEKGSGDAESWTLRYEEFIPLNTWQIQKIKPRVATLEEKVQVLEAENAELKEQIKLLLNPNE